MAAMPPIQKVRYTHDAMIDEILANPSISQGELARQFGYTQTAVSIQVNSDAFKERLAERKGQLTDPMLIASINERLDAIARRSLDKIIERLDRPDSGLKPMELVAIAKLGVGDKNTRPAVAQTQNNLYVVALPPQAKDSSAWLNAAHRTPGGGVPLVEEVPRG